MGVAEIFSSQKSHAKISAPRYPFQLLVPPKQIQQRTLRGFHYYRYPESQQPEYRNTNNKYYKQKTPKDFNINSPRFQSGELYFVLPWGRWHAALRVTEEDAFLYCTPEGCQLCRKNTTHKNPDPSGVEPL